MICYRDTMYCSRLECANEECPRNQAGLDQENVEWVGLPLSIGDMRTETCGYSERCRVCGSTLGDACTFHPGVDQLELKTREEREAEATHDG